MMSKRRGVVAAVPGAFFSFAGDTLPLQRVCRAPPFAPLVPPWRCALRPFSQAEKKDSLLRDKNYSSLYPMAVGPAIDENRRGGQKKYEKE
jgi:hypothetical protein